MQKAAIANTSVCDVGDEMSKYDNTGFGLTL